MPDPLAEPAATNHDTPKARETPMQDPHATESNGRPKHITVVTPCYNEVENVRELYEAIKQVFAGLPQYTYDLIYIDNASKDGTADVLREIAAEDPNVRVIINARNFGHIRSPYHGFLQAEGDAVIVMASDFQDPPALIPDFLRRWEEGYKIVVGVKVESEESRLMYALRSIYYGLAAKLAEIELMQHVTGFGLYDRRVVEILRQIDDPYPYGRGLIADIGLDCCKIPYRQPQRRRGITKNNFYTLYDMAMLGITNHSKVPLRVATMAGFVMSAGGPLPRVRLPGGQAALLELAQRGRRPDPDQPVLLLVGPALLHRHHRRIPRGDSHPGAEAPAGHREGADQLRPDRRDIAVPGAERLAGSGPHTAGNGSGSAASIGR